MKSFTFIVVLALAAFTQAAPAFAQQQRPDWRGKHQGTSRDERERMRQDMRDAYRDRSGDRDRQQERPQRQMSPQEREKLRRDIEDANRGLKR